MTACSSSSGVFDNFDFFNESVDCLPCDSAARLHRPVSRARLNTPDSEYWKELADLLQETLGAHDLWSLRDMLRQLKQKKWAAVQADDVSSTVAGALQQAHVAPMVLEALDGFFFVVNAAAVVEFVSPNVRNYLQISQTEMQNRPIFDFVSTSDQEYFNRMLPTESSFGMHLMDFGGQQPPNKRRNDKFSCRFRTRGRPPTPSTASADEEGASSMTLHVSAMVLPYPVEPDADDFFSSLSAPQPERQLLVCVARRNTDKCSPLLTEPRFSLTCDSGGTISSVDIGECEARFPQLNELRSNNLVQFCREQRDDVDALLANAAERELRIAVGDSNLTILARSHHPNPTITNLVQIYCSVLRVESSEPQSSQTALCEETQAGEQSQPADSAASAGENVLFMAWNSALFDTPPTAVIHHDNSPTPRAAEEASTYYQQPTPPSQGLPRPLSSCQVAMDHSATPPCYGNPLSANPMLQHPDSYPGRSFGGFTGSPADLLGPIGCAQSAPASVSPTKTARGGRKPRARSGGTAGGAAKRGGGRKRKSTPASQCEPSSTTTPPWGVDAAAPPQQPYRCPPINLGAAGPFAIDWPANNPQGKDNAILKELLRSGYDAQQKAMAAPAVPQNPMSARFDSPRSVGLPACANASPWPQQSPQQNTTSPIPRGDCEMLKQLLDNPPQAGRVVPTSIAASLDKLPAKDRVRHQDSQPTMSTTRMVESLRQRPANATVPVRSPFVQPMPAPAQQQQYPSYYPAASTAYDMMGAQHAYPQPYASYPQQPLPHLMQARRPSALHVQTKTEMDASAPLSAPPMGGYSAPMGTPGGAQPFGFPEPPHSAPWHQQQPAGHTVHHHASTARCATAAVAQMAARQRTLSVDVPPCPQSAHATMSSDQTGQQAKSVFDFPPTFGGGATTPQPSPDSAMQLIQQPPAYPGAARTQSHFVTSTVPDELPTSTASLEPSWLDLGLGTGFDMDDESTRSWVQKLLS